MLPYERQGRFYFFSNCPFYQELTLLQIFTASFPSGFIAQSRVTYLIFNQLLAKGNSTIAGTLSVLFIVVFLVPMSSRTSIHITGRQEGRRPEWINYEMLFLCCQFLAMKRALFSHFFLFWLFLYFLVPSFSTEELT